MRKRHFARALKINKRGIEEYRIGPQSEQTGLSESDIGRAYGKFEGTPRSCTENDRDEKKETKKSRKPLLTQHRLFSQFQIHFRHHLAGLEIILIEFQREEKVHFCSLMAPFLSCPQGDPEIFFRP